MPEITQMFFFFPGSNHLKKQINAPTNPLSYGKFK